MTPTLKKIFIVALCCVSLITCAAPSYNTMKRDMQFIERFEEPVLLQPEDSEAIVLVSPKHQGRVLTSALSEKAQSNGWLNYTAIESGEGNPGGEDRLWPAPIGSKFSFFFPAGVSMDNSHWRVPPAFFSGEYTVLTKKADTVSMRHRYKIENHQGTPFSFEVLRTITAYSKRETEKILGISLSKNHAFVGFGSHNRLTNIGENWRVERGLAAPWILGMFRGTEDAIAIFPIKDASSTTEKVGQYIHSIPSDRLVQTPGHVLFKVDGRYQCKIGIPRTLSKNIAGAYSPELKRLSIIQFSFDPEATFPSADEQIKPRRAGGDVSNAYNHGNADGSVANTHSFYELESAGPMKALKTNEYVEHTHNTFHFFGSAEDLVPIAQKLLGVDLLELSLQAGKSSVN